MRYDQEQISKWVSEWEQSSQSITAFCAGKPFEKSTFYYWRKKLACKQAFNEDNKFVAVQFTPSFTPYISLHYPNGVRLELHTVLSGDQIRSLVGC
jgi:hypothetical protein